MASDAVQSLAQSGDDDVREIALQRLLRRSSLSEEDQALLRECVPSLSSEKLHELLARHGDLGCPLPVVQRLVDEMPRDHARQPLYVAYLLDFLPDALDADTYADFVERVYPVTSDLARRMLCARLRGCPLLDAIAKHDGGGPRWAQLAIEGPLGARLLDIRYDERAIRARMERWIAESDVAALLRLRWLSAEIGCADLARTAWERCLDLFPLPEPSQESDREREVRGHHWHLVVAWVNEDDPARAERVAWLAERLDDEFFPGTAFPEGLRDDLAGILVDRGRAPLWAAPVLRRRLAGGGVDAWRTVFTWWPPSGRWLRWGGFIDRYADCKAMVMEAPLPAEAPDDFDQELLRRAEDVMAYEREQIEGRRMMFARGQPLDETLGLEHALEWHPTLHHETARFRPLVTVPRLVDRLLQMPLTPERAKRIARMIKGHGELIRDPRMLDVAALSGPVAPDELPAIEEIELFVDDQVTLYRRLGGSVADERLREHVRRSFALAKAKEGPYFGRRRWHWPWLREVIDDDLHVELTTGIATEPLDEVARLHRNVPWLVGEPMLVAAAQRHLDAGHAWGQLEVPPVLRPFIEERARRTEDDGELAALLEWLEQHGAPRNQRLGIVLARLESRPPTRDLADAAARMLATRTAWEGDGAVFLRALVRWRDWTTVEVVWARLMDTAMYRTPKEDVGKLVAAVHLVFALVILELGEAAAVAADEERLVAALTAVLRLDPPPPIVRELARLKRRKDLSDRAVERIEAGMKLFKSMEGRKPAFDGLYQATRTLRAADAARSSQSLGTG